MIGETISHYRIVKELGAGGMGVVYEAEDLNLKRRVALKFLPAHNVPTQDALERFRREAQSASALNHPNICTIYEIEEHQGHPFIAMELMKGETLQDVIGGKPMPLHRVLELGIQITDALDAAHSQRIIHRDIKPRNIFITERGHAKLLDFGLARQTGPLEETDRNTPTISAVESLTKTGMTMGTLGYISPEQARGKGVDARTDLFSFGVVLYEMLTGVLPFDGETPGEMLEALFTKEPQPVTRLNPDVPVEVERLVSKAIQKDRNSRYQTASELRDDLKLLAGGASFPTVQFARPRPKQWSRFVVFPAALMLLFAVLWYLQRTPKSPDVKTRIVVLPFTNLSGNQSDEYFSDGLTEELLNALARNPKLRVISRTSAFSFKGKAADLKTISEKLNVTHVIEGSVRKEQDRLRITAQLIEATTDTNLWSQTYDRNMQNVFEVQDDIASAVATQLNVTPEGGPVVAQKTEPAAYNAYLHGRYFQGRPSKENLEKAIRYFEEALNIDPNYVRARAGLATAYIALSDWGFVTGDEGYERARKEIATALKADPKLGEGYALQGWILTRRDWNWEGADAAYKRALELQPVNTLAVGGSAGLAATLGRFEEAMQLDRRAIEIDPLRVPLYFNLGSHAFRAGKLREAQQAFRKVLELNPQFGGAHMFLGFLELLQSKPEEAIAEMQKEQETFWREHGLAFAYYAANRTKEADELLTRIVEQSGNTAPYQIAGIYAFRNEKEKAFEWLNRAYEQRDSGLTEMVGDPFLRNLKDDPRYRDLLAKMKLPLRP